MEIKKNNIEIRKNWNKFSFKKLGAVFCLFLIGIVTFISGGLGQVNAVTSSTVLPVAKGGTGVNSLPNNQLLYGNNQGQLVGSNISKAVSFNIELVSNNDIKWGTNYGAWFRGVMQSDNIIFGYIMIDAQINISRNVSKTIANLPSEYTTIEQTQQYGVAFADGKQYIIWTEGNEPNTQILLRYYHSFNADTPLNTDLRLCYNYPIIIKKV